MPSRVYFWGRRQRRGLLPSLIGLVLVVLIVLPIVMIFARAVMVDGRLEFSGAIRTMTNPENLTTISNTLLLGLAVVLGTTIITLPLALILARTQLGRQKWLDTVLMIPFMTPPYIASMGWILFMQKRGLFQQLLPSSGAWSEKFFSFGGLVLVMSLHIFPFMLSILKNAITNISANMEESAAVFGGGFFYRLRRVSLPLISGNYAIGALLVFVKTLSEYGTPATLGRRIGFNVFATNIHQYATISPIDFGRAASLSGVLIFICMAAWLLQNHITTRASYQLVGGKGNRVGSKKLSRLSLITAWFLIAAVIIVAIGIPYFSVISTSVIKLRGYGLAAGNFTFAHYLTLFESLRSRSTFLVSIMLAISSASIATILGTIIAVTVNRFKSRLSKVVEAIGLLPEMLPGIVLVIGIMLFWNRIYRFLPLYNTIGIMVLAYVTLFLPFTIQYVTSSLSQIGENLIQAGRAFGGSPFYVFRRITLPLLVKGIFVGWTMTFIISFRELVTASLVAPPNTLVVSTFIMREFEQGSVSVGMAMAVICVLFTTSALSALSRFIDRQKKPAINL
ncbi:MAG: iron ABC transporter permease [Deltaproteobacteria bacterium]|nr:iron ABC transporter permease [Deltaproteobacteria bacterium]